MEIIEFAWLIPVLPLIAFMIVGLFGHKMPEGGGYVAIIFSLAAMVLSILIAIVLDTLVPYFIYMLVLPLETLA